MTTSISSKAFEEKKFTNVIEKTVYKNSLLGRYSVTMLSKVRGVGSFATFGYSVIPELSCHLRPMVIKGKSLLFGHISRIFKKKTR